MEMDLLSYFRLIRLPNDVMIGIGVLIGEFIALRTYPNIDLSICSFLVGFLISASVMILNDIADINIDKINNPNKPLVKGTISLRSAYYHAIMYGVIGISISFLSTIYNLSLQLYSG